jgi:hypothetical protein
MAPVRGGMGANPDLGVILQPEKNGKKTCKIFVLAEFAM